MRLASRLGFASALLLLFVAGNSFGQVTIKERVDVVELHPESWAVTEASTMFANVTSALQLPCAVRVNDATYIPCPTELEVQDYYVVYQCDMDQGACGDPPYKWVADMTNYDTSALTLTFQDELTHIEESATYNPQVKHFLFDWALVSHSYFGVAHFTVTFSNADGPQAVWGGQIVIDDDNDLIADAWELQHGGMELEMTRPLEGCSAPSDACWDDDGIDVDSLGNGKIGDGISKLDEYRGIFLGPGNTGHTRLDLDSQDVFVDVDLSSYTNEANWALGQLRTQLGMKVHLIDDLDLVLQGGATIPWAGEESFGVFILLNDSSATTYIPDEFKLVGGSDEQKLELLNGYVVDAGTYYWGDVGWDDANCVADNNSLEYHGCQPWQVMTGGPLLGLTDRRKAGNRGVVVSTVYPNGFEGYFDAGRNSIPESANLFFRYQAETHPALPSDDIREFWRSGYNGFDLNEDGDNTDNVSPYELLNEPNNDENDLPAVNNDDVDGYVIGSSFSEQIRRTMLHELFHALSRPGYHPKTGYSVMRSGPGPAHVDSFSADDKAEIDLRIKRGFWLVDHR